MTFFTSGTTLQSAQHCNRRSDNKHVNYDVEAKRKRQEDARKVIQGFSYGVLLTIATLVRLYFYCK